MTKIWIKEKFKEKKKRMPNGFMWECQEAAGVKNKGWVKGD